MKLGLQMCRKTGSKSIGNVLFISLFLFFMVHVNAQTNLPEGSVSSGTYRVPAGVTGISVEVWGGGGAGGYAGTAGQATGGGGGGAYSKVYVIPVTPGEILTVQVGSGGIGSSGESGGGASYVSRGTTNLILAVGGGGVANNNSTGGAGGQAANGLGNIKYSGGKGGNAGSSGTSCGVAAGGGGAGAGTDRDGNGGNNGSGSGNNGGSGGAGVSSGGSGGKGASDHNPGSAGSLYGGGGGGAKRSCVGGGLLPARNGGDGARGVVLVTYVCSEFAIMSTVSSVTEICKNATGVTTNITFSGATSALPTGTYKVTYTVNANQYTADNVIVTSDGTASAGVISGVPIPSAGDNNVVLTLTRLENEVGCGNAITANNTVTIIKKPLPVVTLTRNTATICTHNNVPDPGMSSSVSNTAYTITSIANGVSGNTASITGTVFPADNLVATGTTSGTVTYTIIPLSAGCSGEAVTYTVTVRPVPTIQISSPDDVNNLCHNATIRLQAATTGDVNWIGWYDSEGQLVENSNTQYLPAAVNYMNVTYDPKITEAGKAIKLFARVNNGACGYIADTIHIKLLPLPAVENFELITQPVAFQEMCTDTAYEVKIVSTDTSALYDLKVTLNDYRATGIARKSAEIKYPYTTGTWATLDSYTSDDIRTIWSLPDPLQANDSLLVRIWVSAECSFFSGADLQINLDARGACGDAVTRGELFTDIFYTKQDTVQMNRYSIVSNFNVNAVTNNTGDTVIWQIEAYFDPENSQTTDSTKEVFNILVPVGLTYIDYTPIQNMYDENSLDFLIDDYGVELIIPVMNDLTHTDTMRAEIRFAATGAPCDEYEFYSEIIFFDSVNCGGTSCIFNSTRGGDYPLLEVEWYTFTLVDDIKGEVKDGLWYGYSELIANTQFYVGDTLFVDFYVDRDNSSTLTSGDTLVRRHIYETLDVPEGGTFTDYYDSVYVEQGKQLIGVLTSNAICAESFVFPIVTLMGQDTLCQLDTTYYYTTPGMQQYRWGVEVPDAVSGATPKRIPLEGSSEGNYDNESTVRILWPKEGDYTVYAQYSLNTVPPAELSKTTIKVHVNQRPVIELTTGTDTTICEGTQIELAHFFRDVTGIGTLSYYKRESDGTYTLLPDQSLPVYVKPSDTTIYRVTALSEDSGCEALNPVDFRVNVNKMIQLGTIQVVSQPSCQSNTGSIQLSVQGGSGFYEYSKDNGVSYSDFPLNGIMGNFSAGTYRIYVRDEQHSACEVSISQPVSLTNTGNGLYATAHTTDVADCSAGDGTIQLTVEGGNPPYRYTLNGGSFETLPSDGIMGTDFSAGTYTILVYDENSCYTTPGEVVIEAANGIEVTLTPITPAACTTDGWVSIAVSGGIAPYSYRVSGRGWVTMNDIVDSLHIEAGLHEIFVKDATACATSETVEIENNGNIAAAFIDSSAALCDGLEGGTIQFTVSGDAPLYYSIDGGVNYTAITAGINTIPDLPVGSYQVLLANGNECTYVLEDIRVEKEVNFIQAINNHVHTYVNIDVRGNIILDDYDDKNGRLQLLFASDPVYGTINVSPNGDFVYRPQQDFVGTDSVQYSIQNSCGFQSVSWLYVHVLNSDVPANRPPVAVIDHYLIKQNQPLSNFEVRMNDLDPDGDLLSLPGVISDVQRGTLIQQGDGTFTYTPDVNFTGVDEFMYSVCDPDGLCDTTWAQITVLSADVYDNHAVAQLDAYSMMKSDTLRITNPQDGILGNDHYPAGTTPVLSVINSPFYGVVNLNADGSFTYTPEWGYFGPDAFTYSLCTDDISVKCDTAWVNVFVIERPCPQFSYGDTVTCRSFDLLDLALDSLPASVVGLTMKYYDENDVELQSTLITTAGNYYVKGTNSYGCTYTDTVYVEVLGEVNVAIRTERVLPTDQGNHFSVTTIPDIIPDGYQFYIENNDEFIPLTAYDTNYIPSSGNPGVKYNVLTIPYAKIPGSETGREIYLGIADADCFIDTVTVDLWAMPEDIAENAVEVANALVYNNDNVNEIYITNGDNKLIGILTPGNNHLGMLWLGMETLAPDNSVYIVDDGWGYTYLARRFKIKPEHPVLDDSVTVQIYFTKTELSDLIYRSTTNANQWDNIEGLSELQSTKYSDADAADMSGLGSYTEPNTAGEIARITGRGSYNTGYHFIDITVGSFSTFYLHGGITVAPLPVELLAFKAKCDGNKVLLSWQTATETNNDYFTIERSADGHDFIPVGSVPGAINSTIPLSYSLADDYRASDAVTYYRLKQTDLNGAYNYFDPVAVYCGQLDIQSDYMIYPTPTADKLYLEFTNDILPQGEIEIYNGLGMLLYRSVISHSIDVSHLPNGIYFVKLNTDTQLFPVKKIEKRD